MRRRDCIRDLARDGHRLTRREADRPCEGSHPAARPSTNSRIRYV
jgi:hypothetical protein